jgi:hypothetical protein
MYYFCPDNRTSGKHAFTARRTAAVGTVPPALTEPVVNSSQPPPLPAASTPSGPGEMTPQSSSLPPPPAPGQGQETSIYDHQVIVDVFKKAIKVKVRIGDPYRSLE